MYQKIPGFKRYSIHDSGNIIDTVKNKFVYWSSKHKGMPRVRLIADGETASKQHYVAKVIAKAFIDIPDDVGENPAVGYKDGNKNNVAASNLFWKRRNSHKNSPWRKGFSKIPNYSLDPYNTEYIRDNEITRLLRGDHYG